MLRILQVVNNMHRAGLETMLMNYYRRMDKTIIQFDFLTHRAQRCDYDNEIEDMGGNIYYAPRLYPQNYPSYFKYMNHLFNSHLEYQIVHSHIDTMSYLPLKACKRAGVPVRICHSHNTSIDIDFKYPLKQHYRKHISEVANIYCACGVEAGKFLFPGEKFTIIPNAVDAEKFYYRPKERKNKRNELGIAHNFVIGHVGRFSKQKNHKFLIDIFNIVQQKEKDALLLLIGVGEKQNDIKKYVSALKIGEKVRFLDNRRDVHELYQAMDVFVLPSLYEGVPVVGIEAQFSNLQCLFSEKIPVEVAFSGRTKFIELDQIKWAEAILNSRGEQMREARNQLLDKSHYNINAEYSRLENFYLELHQMAKAGKIYE